MKPIVTEKAVMMIESQNVLTFLVPENSTKPTIKHEIEALFSVKVKSVRVFVRGSKKYAYVKLKPENPAIDVATKLGII